MATFDDLLVEAGGFGLYQRRVFLLIYLTSATFSWLYLGFVFLAVTPDHWCRSPGVSELREKCNWTLDQEKNYTLPAGHPGISSYSQCERFDLDWNSSSVSCDNPLPFAQNHSRDLPLTRCQDGWVFENGSISSIVTEFELVCADAWKVDLPQACLNLGFMVGTIILGYAADIFGRKSCFLFATFVTAASGLPLAFAPSYPWFVILRTLQGLFSRGGWLSAQILMTELVVSEHRRRAGILNQMCFSFGIMVLPAVAYFIPAWRNLQLIITVPNILFLTYYWLIPESPRWMVSQRKEAEAVKVLRQVAARNGSYLSRTARVTDVPLHAQIGHNRGTLHRQLGTIIIEKDDGQVTRPSVLDLVRTPRMRKHTLILMINWFTCALVYQGLVMRLGTLGGNIYLDFFISGAVEIPASVIVLLVIERIGRRLPFATGGLLSGVSCLIAAFIPENKYHSDYILWLKTAVTSLGRLGITVTMEMVCFVNTELYPTFLRSFAVSMCSSLSDLGGIVSPFIVFRLAALWLEMPLVVFGVIGLVSGGLVLLLPETKGLSLPDTIEEIENISRWKRNTLKTTYQKVVLHSTTPTHSASSNL
ncbi:solute carrier family 22 member 2-like [Pristis pectinata]|uniref:solute carrier family 22 member 2-like n=1 Tax=Pristis pectinata TaxID=685728 RepID=UPI00223DEDBF|nr:solute carrier family 22 member 2-like [Pristis pectinata]